MVLIKWAKELFTVGKKGLGALISELKRESGR
jgi:hypothetical protein